MGETATTMTTMTTTTTHQTARDRGLIDLKTMTDPDLNHHQSQNGMTLQLKVNQNLGI